MSTSPRWLIVPTLLLLTVGCAHRGDESSSRPLTTQPTTTHVDVLLPATYYDAVRAECRPPVGWTLQPAEKQPDSEHQLWVSPTGSTAYGVIVVRHWLMPLASDERVLGEFLKNMKASDGRADLLSKAHDGTLARGIGGIRFDVTGGKYTLRASLVSTGQRAWVVYAGTLNAQPVNPTELQVAESARDHTVIEPAMRRTK